MVIYIPDDTIKEAGLDPIQIQLELAIFLYQKEYLSLAQAAKMTGRHRIELQQELGKRQIPIHHSIEELQHQLDILQII
ncbi:MAG: hypothetical protein HC892_21080 [Saprospiraceae bacterium]|nr:hypothetical protein [Saprospiraceae bacterium]